MRVDELYIGKEKAAETAAFSLIQYQVLINQQLHHHQQQALEQSLDQSRHVRLERQSSWELEDFRHQCEFGQNLAHRNVDARTATGEVEGRVQTLVDHDVITYSTLLAFVIQILRE